MMERDLKQSDTDGDANTDIKPATTGGFRERLKDKSYRDRLIRSGWIGFSFFATGVVESQRGPAFPDIQLITNSGVEAASKFLTFHSAGFLCGTVLVGLLSRRKISSNLSIFLGNVLSGVFFIIMPHCSIYILMILVNLVTGLTVSLSETSGNAEQMRLWGNEGKTLIQLLHFIWSMGGVLSPFITEPFLTKRKSNIEDSTASALNISNSDRFNALLLSMPIFSNTSRGLLNQDFSGNLNIDQQYNLTNSSHFVGYNISDSYSENEVMGPIRLHYAFLISGIMSIVFGIPFLVFYIKDRANNSNSSAKEEIEVKLKSRHVSFTVQLIVSIGICFFFFCYTSVEDPFSALIMTFMIREFKQVSKSEAAFLTGFYWIAFASSRFLMIFVSKILSAAQLLFLCLSLMLISISGFTICALYQSVIGVKLFTACMALGMSAVFPGAFTWCQSELVQVRGVLTSAICFSASLGVIINPLIIGALLERLSNMWFCYVIGTQVVLTSAVFLFLFIFNRLYINKTYGKLYFDTENEITVDTPSDENYKAQQRALIGSDTEINAQVNDTQSTNV